jgi:elongation factor P
MAIKVTDVRRGMILKIDNEYFQVTKHTHTTPGKGQAIHHVNMKHLLTGRQKELRLSTGAPLDDVALDKNECQYLYRDGNGHVFMDNTSYEQFHLPDEMVQDELRFLNEGDVVIVCFIENQPRLLELPPSVVLEVIEAEDVAKGDTATSVQKTIKVNTGYELKAPAHIKMGDKVKITTEDGLYSSRAND